MSKEFKCKEGSCVKGIRCSLNGSSSTWWLVQLALAAITNNPSRLIQCDEHLVSSDFAVGYVIPLA